MLVSEGYLALLKALVGQATFATGIKMCFGTDATPVTDDDTYLVNGNPRYTYQVTDSYVTKTILGSAVKFTCVLPANFTTSNVTFKDVAIVLNNTLICREVLADPIAKTTKNRFEVTINLTPTTNGMTVVGYDEVLYSELNP